MIIVTDDIRENAILEKKKTEKNIIMEETTTNVIKNKRKKSVRIFSPFSLITKLPTTDKFSRNSSINEIDLNYHATNAALTKISWLQNPKEILQELLRMKMGNIYFKKYLDIYGNVLIESKINFLHETMEIENEKNPQKQIMFLQAFYLNKRKNRFFHFQIQDALENENENENKKLPYFHMNLEMINWTAALQEMKLKILHIVDYLIIDFFPRFLDHTLSVELIQALHTGTVHTLQPLLLTN